MKYSVGLLGVLLACSSVWATPEKMTMYATLSAPIASFWSVETKSCTPVTMPEDSELNLGFGSTCEDSDEACKNNRAAGGTIQLKGSKPLQIDETLNMEKGTGLEIGKRWMVDTLEIGKRGTVKLGGNLIVKELTLTLPDDSPVTITVSNILRLGSDITVSGATFEKIEIGDCENSEPGAIRYFCSANQNESGTAGWDSSNKFLIKQ